MGWFSKFFEKEDWRLVGTIESGIVHTSPLLDEPRKGTLYYFLYENQHGDRRFDVSDTLRGEYKLEDLSKGDIVYRLDDYMTKVKPWLGGRKITGITSYAKAPMHDMKNRLTNGE